MKKRIKQILDTIDYLIIKECDRRQHWQKEGKTDMAIESFERAFMAYNIKLEILTRFNKDGSKTSKCPSAKGHRFIQHFLERNEIPSSFSGNDIIDGKKITTAEQWDIINKTRRQ